MSTAPIDLSICQDCLVWHANGDDSGFGPFSMDELTVSALQHHHDVTNVVGIESYDYIVVTDEELGFCRSSCDTCGNRLHGDRYGAVMYPFDEE